MALAFEEVEVEGEIARVGPDGVPRAPDVLEEAEVVLNRFDDAVRSEQGRAEVSVASQTLWARTRSRVNTACQTGIAHP